MIITGGNLTTGNLNLAITTDVVWDDSSSYMVDAVRWGQTAGEEWIQDLQQTSTGTSITIGSNSSVCWGGCDWAQPTEEQARRRREAEYATDRASWKAHDLLMRNLTPGQREDYEERGRFTVKTRRGHRYVIGSARCQNVVRVNRRGKPMRAYCVSVHGGVPLEDVLLGQKLMLDHDEPHFLEVARQWPIRFALGVGDLVTKKPSGFSIIEGASLTIGEAA